MKSLITLVCLSLVLTVVLPRAHAQTELELGSESLVVPEATEPQLDLRRTSLKPAIAVMVSGWAATVGFGLSGWFHALGHAFDGLFDTAEPTRDSTAIGLGTAAVISAGIGITGVAMLIERSIRRHRQHRAQQDRLALDAQGLTLRW